MEDKRESVSDEGAREGQVRRLSAVPRSLSYTSSSDSESEESFSDDSSHKEDEKQNVQYVAKVEKPPTPVTSSSETLEEKVEEVNSDHSSDIKDETKPLLVKEEAAAENHESAKAETVSESHVEGSAISNAEDFGSKTGSIVAESSHDQLVDEEGHKENSLDESAETSDDVTSETESEEEYEEEQQAISNEVKAEDSKGVISVVVNASNDDRKADDVKETSAPGFVISSPVVNEVVNQVEPEAVKPVENVVPVVIAVSNVDKLESASESSSTSDEEDIKEETSTSQFGSSTAHNGAEDHAASNKEANSVESDITIEAVNSEIADTTRLPVPELLAVSLLQGRARSGTMGAPLQKVSPIADESGVHSRNPLFASSRLEKKLTQRPDRSELVERNIIADADSRKATEEDAKKRLEHFFARTGGNVQHEREEELQRLREQHIIVDVASAEEESASRDAAKNLLAKFLSRENEVVEDETGKKSKRRETRLQKTAAPQIDAATGRKLYTNPLFQHMKLEKMLSVRPQRDELEQRNILHNTQVDEKLKENRDAIGKFFEKKTSAATEHAAASSIVLDREALKERGILVDPAEVEKSRTEARNQLDSFLKRETEEVKDEKTGKSSLRRYRHLEKAKAVTDSDGVTAFKNPLLGSKRLERKLKERPALTELQQRNILRTESEEEAKIKRLESQRQVDQVLNARVNSPSTTRRASIPGSPVPAGSSSSSVPASPIVAVSASSIPGSPAQVSSDAHKSTTIESTSGSTVSAAAESVRKPKVDDSPGSKYRTIPAHTPSSITSKSAGSNAWIPIAALCGVGVGVMVIAAVIWNRRRS